MTPETRAQDPLCTEAAPTACTEGLSRTPGAARGGPVSHAVSRVARLHRLAAGRALRATGLYPGQEILMMHLWDAGAVRQSELIRVMELDPSTVTKMLQRLEQSGHVRRRPDPADRRASLVEATPAGQALRHEVEAAWCGLEDTTLAGLDPAERALLSGLLEKLEANLCPLVSEEECLAEPGAPARRPTAGRKSPSDGR
ncbi:MarR family winged helix-turn-helix transcriptional regulator [Streptomyces sp. NPDC059070]|uniref:MarR family winged helix-turn-helix transcriptional regulator n=1 Tax=unclassified Streptomyces TaxID=2593676 RepID=UPI0034E1A763